MLEGMFVIKKLTIVVDKFVYHYSMKLNYSFNRPNTVLLSPIGHKPKSVATLAVSHVVLNSNPSSENILSDI